jgi:excisionase family DNA binding protein
MRTVVNHEDKARQASMRWAATPSPELPPPLTVAEFCAHTGMTDDAVYAAINDGRCPHVRYGKTIRIPVSVLTTGWER